MTPPVVIVGAGLAGLCCGRRLAQCGVPFVILEAADAVGGRVRTDLVDGFRLDRGFQIYLTAYPEGRRVLDLDALGFKPFARGALVRYRGKFHRVMDPRSAPLAAAASVFGPVGTIRDKVRVGALGLSALSGSVADQVAVADKPTLDVLRWDGGLSDAMIDRLFRFLFRCFAQGPGAVPAAGMQAIPEQIAAGLPAGSIRLGAAVAEVGAAGVTLGTGERVAARAVVVATDGADAARLSGGATADPGWRGSTTLYYATDRPPTTEPILHLAGDGSGPVSSLLVISAAAPSYAPAGQALISASCVGNFGEADDVLDRRARGQLTGWFGPGVPTWRLVRVYRVPRGLPAQPAGALDPWERSVRVRPGLYVCGDHRDNASIDGAMMSGFRAAQAVMADTAGTRKAE